MLNPVLQWCSSAEHLSQLVAAPRRHLPAHTGNDTEQQLERLLKLHGKKETINIEILTSNY